MVYVYDFDNQELEVLNKYNLKNRTVIIDKELFPQKEIIKTKRTLRQILLSEIDIGNIKDKNKKKGNTLEIIFKENHKQLNISKEVIFDMKKSIGVIKMIVMENPVYSIDSFIINIEQKTGKKAVVKTGKIYRTFRNGKLLTIENIYEIPEMKLWDHTKEYMVILK